jgi:hypothetical protein
MKSRVIIQVVGRNRREDAALQRGADNALRSAGLSRVLVSHPAMVRGFSLCRVLTNIEMSKQVRKGVRYSSRYTRLCSVSKSSLTSKDTSAHFMPRQLRGPFREGNQPTLQSFGSWLKPPIRKKLVRPIKNIFR